MSRIIVKNIPKEIKEYELKDHFSSKGEITDVKIMRKEDGTSRKFAFVGFKDESQGKDAIKYFNNTFIKTCRIQVEEAKIQGDSSLAKPWSKHSKWSKDDNTNKETKESKIKKLLELAELTSTKSKFDKLQQNDKNDKIKENIEKSNTVEQVSTNESGIEESKQIENFDPKRLYIRNIPFDITEEDLSKYFEKYGQITELHIPINYKTNQSFGYAYISYATVESTVLALSERDKTLFMGRVLHITPAKAKQEKEITLPVKDENSSFKNQKKEKSSENFDNEVNWNYLFLNQNAVLEAVSKKLEIPKSELLSSDNPQLAVQVATMETMIINETKNWLQEVGIDLEKLKGKRTSCVRSKTIILIKNIHHSTKADFLESLFARFGHLVRFMVSPNNTIAVAEYIDMKHALNCLKKLSYYEIEGLPLYLEYAPEGFIKKNNENTNNNTIDETTNNNKNQKSDEFDFIKNEGKIVFINNLNFTTKEAGLKNAFAKRGFVPSSVKIVTHNKNGKDLSAGFAFIEFENPEIAIKAIKTLQGFIIDGHSLKLSLAKSKEEKKNLLQSKRKAEKELNEADYEGDEVEQTKILVKNLAFEATENELRTLFKSYGEVKSVRLPKKLDAGHRGFAFIDFISHEEAKNAFKSLQNTHFYGRKLVLEWAQKDKDVEELRETTDRRIKAASIVTHRAQSKGLMKLNKN